MNPVSRRTASLLLALAFGTPLSSVALGDEYVLCDDGLRRLSFYGEGEKSVGWGKKLDIDGTASWASCGFREGIDIPLKAINDWSIDVSGKNVRIFHGVGNVCSAGQFLLYNQLSKIVLIVHSDFTTEKFECE